MSTWFEKIRNVFAAAAMAEAGEDETALRIMGHTPRPKTKPVSFQNLMAAVTYAEAGCHDEARSFMGYAAQPALRPQAWPIRLGSFMADVGLEGVKVRYGVVQAATRLKSFMAEVGLERVNVHYGVAPAA